MTTGAIGSGRSEALVRRLETLGALCGAVGGVLFAIGAAATDVGGKGFNPTLSAGSTLAILVPYAASYHLAAAALSAASVALVVGFVALSRRLGANREGSPSAQLVLVGGAMLVGLGLLLAALSLALAVALEGGNGEAALVIGTIEWEFFRLFLPPAIVIAWATTWASIRDRALPAPFGWISAGYAALLTVALIPVFPAGLMAMTFFLWLILVSLLMAVLPRARTGAVAATPQVGEEEP
jgi:hypothetical protein